MVFKANGKSIRFKALAIALIFSFLPIASAGYLTFDPPINHNFTFTGNLLPPTTITNLPISVIFYINSFSHSIQPNIFNPQPISLDPFSCKKIDLIENISTQLPNFFGRQQAQLQDYADNGYLYEIFWTQPYQYGATMSGQTNLYLNGLIGIAKINSNTLQGSFPLPNFMANNWNGWVAINYLHPGIGNCGVLVNRNSPLVTQFNYNNLNYISLPVGSSFVITSSSGSVTHYYLRDIQLQNGQSSALVTFTSLDSYATLQNPNSLNQLQFIVNRPSSLFGGSLTGKASVLDGNIPVFLDPSSPSVIIIPHGSISNSPLIVY